ncbi:MAG: hypothetical protein RJQ08_07885 [Salinisphaeraceae bacterium]
MTQSQTSLPIAHDPTSGVVPRAVSLLRRHADGRPPQLTAAARRQLEAHAWASEAALERCLQRALVLCDGRAIEPRHLGLSGSATDHLRREQRRILNSLRAARGLRRDAAARLGIAPRVLRLKLAELKAQGIGLPAFAPDEAELRHE